MNKIVFVNRFFAPDHSATSQMLTDLAFGLAARGVSIHVICSRQCYDQPGADLPACESIHGVAVRRVWTTRFGRGRLWGRALDYATFYWSSTAMLALLLRRGDTVVAMTDPPLLSIPAIVVARLRGASLVNWLQDVFPEVASRLGANPLPGWLDALLRRMRNASLRGARMNVVLGGRMREHLMSQHISARNMAVIENWAGAAAAEPLRPDASRLRARLSLQGKFIVAYSGNLGRAHEFNTLLDAARLLKDEREILFLMIGGGAGMAPLQRAVLQEGLDNFRFLDYQPRNELPDSLAAADVHLVSLLPALEGLIVPSKFYGILAAGRPVVFVGDPDGEVSRIIVATGVGLAVGVGDSAELARSLQKLRDDGPARDAMGRRGFAVYVSCYTPQRALRRWSDLLVSDGQALPAPLCFDDLQVDEKFVGGAHPAEIEARQSIEKAQADNV